MKSAHNSTKARSVLLATLGASLTLSSCSLPPRVAWQRMKEEGVLRALFSPRHRATAAPGSYASTGSKPAATSWGTATSSAMQQPSPSLVNAPTAPAPNIPTAEAFPGKPGFVYSPHTRPKKLVNVGGFGAGEQVLCPYTLEPFKVPDLGQGAAVAQITPSSAFGPSSPKKSSASSNTDLVSRDDTGITPPDKGPAYGRWVENKPGFVYSPFAARHQLVDVTGIAPGVEVKCPYSGKVFRVPELPTTANTPAEVTPHDPVKEDKPAENRPEPKPADKPAGTKPTDHKPAASTPSTPPADPAASANKPMPTENLPTATWVDGKPGIVQSPFGEPGQLVDVTGKEPGSKAVCPYTNKPFIVPAPK